jgi:hypothetical protein
MLIYLLSLIGWNEPAILIETQNLNSSYETLIFSNQEEPKFENLVISSTNVIDLEQEKVQLLVQEIPLFLEGK